LGKSACWVWRKNNWTDAIRNSELSKDGRLLHELTTGCSVDIQKCEVLVLWGKNHLIYELMIMSFSSFVVKGFNWCHGAGWYFSTSEFNAKMTHSFFSKWCLKIIAKY
jgi:hypothetical protein